MPAFQKFGRNLISAAILVTLASCATTEKEADQLAVDTYNQEVSVDGVPGGLKQRVSILTAEVKKIDYTSRKATLVDKEGNQKTLHFGPEAINFDQVKTGDVVRIEMVEEAIVYLSDSDEHDPDQGAGLAARSAEGEKPLVMIGGAVDITAKVIAVDLEAHAATLLFNDGTERVIAVRPDVELSEAQVGRTVVMQITTAMALSVEKPAESQ